jgi:WXG100 family type VII secretion target
MTVFEQHLEQVLEQLAAEQDSLGSQWDGDGGRAQQGAQSRWAQGAAEMRTALADLRRITGGAQENYRGAMQMNALNWD